MPKKDAKTEKTENEARIAEGQLAPFLEKIAPNLMKFMKERGLKPTISWQGPAISYANAGYVFKNEELRATEAERKR